MPYGAFSSILSPRFMEKEQSIQTNVRGIDVDNFSQEALHNGSYQVDEQARPRESTTTFSPQPLIILMISVTAFAFLVAWLVVYLQGSNEAHQWWISHALGGRLTQGQAKAIDFVTGAILTPVLVAGLSLVWFASARIAICTERGAMRGTSLRALVEASCTGTGSYSPFKFKVLLTSSRLPLVLLAFLALVVALASSFLANVIAYEAFDVAWPGSTVNLSHLSDSIIERKGGRSFLAGPSGMTYYNPYEFNTNQKADFSNQVTGLWTGITFANSSNGLETDSKEGPAYIGINATNASLTSMDVSMTRLSRVDAYRLTLQCEAVSPTWFGALEMGTYTTEIASMFNTTSANTVYNAYYPGVLSSLQTATNDNYYFAGFPLVSAVQVYLGILTSYTYENETMNSTYGSVVPNIYNMTQYGFTGTKGMMQSWGLNCTLFRQQGTVDLVRANQDWRRENASFSDAKNVVQMLIYDWQVAFAYSAPGAANPGIAPALSGGNSLDLDAYASNYLYAAAETERMAYEVAASDQSRANGYVVEAVKQRQFYRMTYVPAILLAALLSLCIASFIVVVLVWYSRRSLKDLRGRQVDALRLMSDSIGLQEFDICPEADWSMDKLEKWSDKLRVCYQVSTEEDKTNVRLMRCEQKDQVTT